MRKIRTLLPLIGMTSLGLCLIASLGFLALPIQERDRKLYAELTAQSNPDQKSVFSTQQTRERVHKHIWYQNQEPLYSSIKSKTSNLILTKQESKIEIIEDLHDVTCVMQQELFYQLPDGSVIKEARLDAEPWQKVRYLKAKEARYYYQTYLFTAKDVQIWEYQLPGHTPPESFQALPSLLEARAEKVQFILKSDQFDFTAHKMHAIFQKSPL